MLLLMNLVNGVVSLGNKNNVTNTTPASPTTGNLTGEHVDKTNDLVASLILALNKF
jgi:hypothetical protein